MNGKEKAHYDLISAIVSLRAAEYAYAQAESNLIKARRRHRDAHNILQSFLEKNAETGKPAIRLQDERHE
jgi:cellobiose-specific phosphotransferase system component IIA